MNPLHDILNKSSHRPYNLPPGPWKFYQEWNKVLFLHWEIPFDILSAIVPRGLNIDSYNGKYFVSVVAFTVNRIRHRYLPAISFISDFHEVNLRTYVDNNGKKGVYFLDIKAGKLLSVIIAGKWSGLPYEKASIRRTPSTYRMEGRGNRLFFHAGYEIKDKVNAKSGLDVWLTERYCLYLSKAGKLFRYDVHHPEWSIDRVNVTELNLNYKAGGFELRSRLPDYSHYSEGVKVVAWRKERL